MLLPTKVAGVHWASPEQTQIAMLLDFADGTVDSPFVTSASDRTTHGQVLFLQAKAGEFGPIGPYVAPTIYPTPVLP